MRTKTKTSQGKIGNLWWENKHGVHVMKHKSLYGKGGYIYKLDDYFDVDQKVKIL